MQGRRVRSDRLRKFVGSCAAARHKISNTQVGSDAYRLGEGRALNQRDQYRRGSITVLIGRSAQGVHQSDSSWRGDERRQPWANWLTHSALRPADLATAAHFFVSEAMKVANSDGVQGLGSAPNAVSLVRSSADFTPALMTALSFSTMLAGVPAGATMPTQKLTLNSSYPSSAIVGTSGNSA